MLAHPVGNLLINGDFAPGLWTRLACPEDGIECAVWRQTFAADRWSVRYARAEGAPVWQGRSSDIPPHASVSGSLEIGGAEGVTQAVLVGQRIEATEAARYRRPLVFSAWLRVGGSETADASVRLLLGSPLESDVFDRVRPALTEEIVRPTGRWVHLECSVDGRAFGATGLSLELEFPAKLLARSGASIRLAEVRLDDGSTARPAAAEMALARRFFQRYDSTRINSLGRALVVNAHELHFQFVFDEMRAFPACTLPHREDVLRVFDLEGVPQTGFSYDVTYRSRGSVIIRATKENHGVRDGFLSFVGTEGAILLDAEL